MGMKIATKTNVRTTQAARTSLPQALKVSFGGGTVMGLGVAGLAVLGLTGFFIIFFRFFMNGVWTNTEDMTIVLETLAGFLLEQNLSHYLHVLVVEFIQKLPM
jgi:K(+)-stimulated pyrophosphate-energized sodium pump